MVLRDGADSVVVFVDDNVVVESRTVATPFSRRLEAASSQMSIGTASNNEEETLSDESNLSPLSSRGGCNVDVNDEAFITELNTTTTRSVNSIRNLFGKSVSQCLVSILVELIILVNLTVESSKK